jgi:hypothetical protein
MPIIINILPNVYWLYNNPNNLQSTGDYKIEMRKYGELIGVKSIIELDENLTFWQKSSSYINEIKVQMEKDEFSKLLAILKKLNSMITNAYTMNEPCIISTYGQPYLEIGLAIWIYFFNQNAGISFDNVIKLLGYKMIGQVSLSDTMKKFFAFLNLNNVSNSGSGRL